MEKRAYAALGHIRVDRITPLDIQRYVRSLVADGLSADNVKNHVRLVSVIMNYAVKKQILTFNPCITVDYPTSQKKERDYYSVEEVKKLFGLFAPHHKNRTMKEKTSYRKIKTMGGF